MTDLEPRRNSIASEVLSNVSNEVAKAIAVLIGFDAISASAVGGTVGGLVKSAHPALISVIERRQQRLRIALDEATHVGGDLDELLTTALDDDRKIELLAQALESAQKTADHQRVRFYGRIAAKGVLAEDTARVDEAQRIFSSLAALDAVDVKVLLHMCSEEDRKWRKYDSEGGPSLAMDLPEVGTVLDAVIPRLEAQGLITSNAGSTFLSSMPTWWVTDYGKLCVSELLEPSWDPGSSA
ncbi:hypothetical protein F4560_008707 [Saccharothrix ecbatanensis]|uniref:Uncharacterized protein n=1 Tax=Saccharothrix ecbatanensis TaxID=1105145 RepID=A0A7W9HUV8_9PSEU|nr:hypothetical protein [Saccharothrix ecbatanensis]MBB5808939.1 hypothetical protein [Saccharothrix ecbatanensis]